MQGKQGVHQRADDAQQLFEIAAAHGEYDALFGGIGWYLFTHALLESRWFPGHHAGLHILIIHCLILFAVTGSLQALLDAQGGRAVGMGLLFIQAVTFADIPVMAAYLCLIALIFVVINLIVDLLYFAVDPRLRVEKAGGH